MFGGIGLPRFLGAVARVLVAALALLLPQLATAALVAAILLAVNAIEAWRVQTSRPLLLLPTPWRH